MKQDCSREERYTQEQLRFILDSAGIGTWSWYPQQNTIHWDAICKHLFGFSGSDTLSYQQAKSYIHPGDLPMVEDAMQQAIDPQLQNPYDVVFRTVNSGGQLRWLHCKGKAYFDDNGDCHLSGIAQDITEMHRKDTVLKDIEQRFQLAFDHASVGIVITDVLGSFLLINKAYTAITGYTQCELYAHSYTFITHPHDLVWNASLINSLSRGEIPSFNINKRYIRKDGTVIWVNHNATLIEGREGAEKIIFSIVREVTAELKAREDLELSIEGGELGLWHVELPERRFSCDNYCRNLLHLGNMPSYPYQDIIDCIAPEHREELLRQIRAAMKPENANTFDAEFKTSCTGEQRWVRMKGRVVLSNDKVYRLAGTMQDISTQKQLQEYRNNFLGIASHELKTPITSMKVYAQLLQGMLEEAGGNREHNMIRQINKQIKKLTYLIGNLLDVTRLQAGKLLFAERFFHFDEMVAEVADELQHTTHTHTITRHLGGVGEVWGDRERLAQVVTNLISNAIKYSPGASSIIVRTSLNDGEVLLCVEDFGIGIPEANQPFVFDQYYRVSGQQQYTIPGLGLGLYISSEIVKREGGRIWVESEEGKGATFCFVIPVNHREL